ncbi:hypothetical protein KBA63_05850, partial [Candidatus Woesebacteria bacterium]|nr:hypothetical protein [Candidatus Woesebacteria bacterium]
DMRNNLQEKNTLWRKNMKEKKVEIKATRKEILENRITSMSQRFETLMTRIQSRIDKIKASGQDTTKAQAQLVVAQTTFTEIKKQITSLSAVTGVQTPDQGTLVELKEKMKKLQEQLKDVLKSLEVEKSATTTQ